MRNFLFLGCWTIAVSAVLVRADLTAIVCDNFSGSNMLYEVDLEAGTSQYLGTSSFVLSHDISAIDFDQSSGILYGIEGYHIVGIDLTNLQVSRVDSVRPSNSLAIDESGMFYGNFGGNSEFSCYDATSDSITQIDGGAYTNGIAINENTVLRYFNNGDNGYLLTGELNEDRDGLIGVKTVPIQLLGETIHSIDHWQDDVYFLITDSSKIYKLDLDRNIVSYVMETPQQFYQSNLSITIIPEPCSLLLLGLGGGLIRMRQ